MKSNSADTIRAFFAIDLPDDIKLWATQIIHQLQVSLKKKLNISWVNPHHLHLTLQFLAAIKPIDMPNLLGTVGLFLKEQENIRVELGHLELFPTPYDPHIFSIHVGPDMLLAELAKKIGESIQNCGYSIERRPFRGHLTLGRIKASTHKIKLVKSFLDSTIEKISAGPHPGFLANEIIFYRSMPSSEGSNYIVLQKFPLKTAQT